MSLLKKIFSKDETEKKAAVEYYVLDNKYKTVKIGNQQWMAGNLNLDHFRNGDPIPEVRDFDRWCLGVAEKKPAWCYYENNSENGEKYGKLYNWFAVNDPRGLAPPGWHIPSDEEWQKLIDYLGGDIKAGKKMKNTSGWDEKSENATNESGFSALPGGHWHIGHFSNSGTVCHWWTSTEVIDEFLSFNTRALSLFLVRDRNPNLIFQADEKEFGLSVRCIRDTEIPALIEAGMSYDEVVKLIGSPAKDRSTTATDIYGDNIPESKETDVFYYFENYPECDFSIHFSHNKVVSVKSYPKSK